MELDKNQKIIILLLIVVLIILLAISAFSLMQKNTKTLQINDINIEQDAFGIYNLVGHITPEKDFDYLEARIIFYDNNSTVIGKSPCAWNTANAKNGEKLSLGNSLGAVCDGTPSYAVIEFYDNVYSKTPLINATIHFNGNNTDATTDTPSAVATPSNDSNNKYSEEDINNARSEGYNMGYDDASYDYDDDYYESDSSSSDYGGSSSSGGSGSYGDSGSGSGSGSSSGGSSSGSSDVEIITDY